MQPEGSYLASNPREERKRCFDQDLEDPKPVTQPLHQDDRLLVRRLLAGDSEAFESFFEGYYPALYRFASRRLGSDTDGAADVAQNALIKAIGKLATYRGEAALTSWLFTFCRREISAHYKRQGRLAQQLAWVDDLPEVRAVLETLAAPAGDQPDDRLRHKELAALVQMTLDYLPTHYGQALEWKYMQELSVKDIARRMGLAPKAAESLLTRARQAFRDAFAGVAQGGLGASPDAWAFARQPTAMPRRGDAS